MKAFAILLALSFTLAADPPAADAPPQLLLNAQRIRRLKRDRERKTARWTNFENRVKNASDSPERGFELALYYVVTGDEDRAREAVAWARAHGCERRQSALVLDWCRKLASGEDKKAPNTAACTAGTNPAVDWRDRVFSAIARGDDLGKLTESLQNDHAFYSLLAGDRFMEPAALYAAAELAYALRTATHADLREQDTVFFSQLPSNILLSLQPEELARPGWLRHAAALLWVTIDPNLPASQFLQSWAMEESQTVSDGPGVAYELLWADPYLPGVGYQNLDPWSYNAANGRLFARASWEPNACWVDISSTGIRERNCPTGWQNQPAKFGRLTLVPLKDKCIEIPRMVGNLTVILWRLKPSGDIVYGKGSDKHTTNADPAGMWRSGVNIEGKVCTASR